MALGLRDYSRGKYCRNIRPSYIYMEFDAWAYCLESRSYALYINKLHWRGKIVEVCLKNARQRKELNSLRRSEDGLDIFILKALWVFYFQNLDGLEALRPPFREFQWLVLLAQIDYIEVVHFSIISRR